MDEYGMTKQGWEQANKLWGLYKVNLTEAAKAIIPMDKELENCIRNIQKVINSEADRRGIEPLVMIAYFAINQRELEELTNKQGICKCQK